MAGKTRFTIVVRPSSPLFLLLLGCLVAWLFGFFSCEKRLKNKYIDVGGFAAAAAVCGGSGGGGGGNSFCPVLFILFLSDVRTKGRESVSRSVGLRQVNTKPCRGFLGLRGGQGGEKGSGERETGGKEEKHRKGEGRARKGRCDLGRICGRQPREIIHRLPLSGGETTF